MHLNYEHTTSLLQAPVDNYTVYPSIGIGYKLIGSRKMLKGLNEFVQPSGIYFPRYVKPMLDGQECRCLLGGYYGSDWEHSQLLGFVLQTAGFREAKA